MFRAAQFRAKAAESAESAKNTDVPSEIRKFQASMESFRLLAQNEDWLADSFDKMIHSQDVLSQDEVVGERLDRRSVAEVEEHILRCLGAAVIMQWKTIPTKLRRELFDTAGYWVTYYKRSRSEARLPASYIATRTKRCP